ncbi:MAG: amidohydrolase family protein [bacterium]
MMLALLISTSAVDSPSLLAGTTPEYGIRDKTPNLKAFIHARIYVSPEIVYDDAVLIVEDDFIRVVGKNVAIPAGADTIDLRGSTIYPGFIDAYTNYGVEKPEKQRRRWGSGPQYEAERVGGNAWNEAIHSERNWVGEFGPDDKVAEELRGQGFTVVQSVRKDGILRGRSFVASLGDGLTNDLILRPYSWHCASFDKGSAKQEYPSSLMGSIALLRQTLYDVQWYGQAHAAYALNPDQEMPEFNQAIEALAGLEREHLIFEAGDAQSQLRAARLAREFGLDLIQVGSGHEYEILSQLGMLRGGLILPVAFPEPPEVGSLEDELDVSLAQLRHWERAPYNPAALSDAGISFALTTHELKKPKDFLGNVRAAVKRGLLPKTALAALTTVPAKLCGLEDRLGTLQPGKLANFIVCDDEIFGDEATIYSVWIQGHEYEQEPLPLVDFRGDYDLSTGTLELTLSLSGKPSKPKGEFKLGELEGKLQSVSTEANQLHFAFELDTLGVSGRLRFSGRLAEDTLSGKCIMPDGAWQHWRAIRTAAYVPKPDSSKPEIPEALVSHQTFPNKAFAFETLPKQEDVLVTNATVWTSEDAGIMENADLLILDGKVEAVGQHLVAPPGARVIDATGKHVTAGIIDAHSHIAIAGDVNEGSEAISAEVRIADVVDPTDINIYRQLAAGVTASHILHGSANPIGGQVCAIKLRWGSSAEELILDAPATIKFALGENVKQSNWGERYNTRYPQSRMGVEAIIRDAFQAAKEYSAAWAKYNRLSKKEQARTIPPRRDLELEALAEVLARRMFIACHAYVQSEMLMLMRLTQEYGFMVRSFEHGLEAYKIAPEIAAAGVGVATFPDWWAYKFEVYDAIPQNASLLTEAGVVVAIKSDSPEMARRLPQEAAKSIMYTGLSQEETIKHVTINPAKLLMVDDRIGSLQAGKDGDFVIWNGNPLSIYTLPEQTWIEGAKYFDREVDRQMREDLRAEKSALIQKILKQQDKQGKGDSSRPDRKPAWQDPGERLEQFDD